MRRRGLRPSLIGLVALALVLAVTLGATVAAGIPRAGKKLTPQALRFHDAMRKLWEDHVTWTRLFIVEFAAGSPATQPTAERLLRNQADIGDAIKPFYGDEAGDRLAALLRDHILIAADLLAAAKAGNQQGVEEASARWYANADAIARFLAAANPDNWPFDEMRAMMRTHLDLTLAEAVARLHGDFAADIAAYEKVHEQALEMADMLSSGIIAQFPKDF
jgi:hypothetical protein